MTSTGATTALGSTPVDVINQNIAQQPGTYKITVSYLWNGDGNTSDFRSTFSVGGVNPYSGSWLQSTEPKDNQGNELGTFSQQLNGFTKVFTLVVGAADPAVPVVLQCFNENGAEASIIDAIIMFERITL